MSFLLLTGLYVVGPWLLRHCQHTFLPAPMATFIALGKLVFSLVALRSDKQTSLLTGLYYTALPALAYTVNNQLVYFGTTFHNAFEVLVLGQQRLLWIVGLTACCAQTTKRYSERQLIGLGLLAAGSVFVQSHRGVVPAETNASLLQGALLATMTSFVSAMASVYTDLVLMPHCVSDRATLFGLASWELLWNTCIVHYGYHASETVDWFYVPYHPLAWLYAVYALLNSVLLMRVVRQLGSVSKYFASVIAASCTALYVQPSLLVCGGAALLYAGTWLYYSVSAQNHQRSTKQNAKIRTS